MKRPIWFYKWMLLSSFFIVLLWYTMEIVAYKEIRPNTIDTIILICYLPVIAKAYDIGFIDGVLKSRTNGEKENG